MRSYNWYDWISNVQTDQTNNEKTSTWKDHILLHIPLSHQSRHVQCKSRVTWILIVNWQLAYKVESVGHHYKVESVGHHYKVESVSHHYKVESVGHHSEI